MEIQSDTRGMTRRQFTAASINALFLGMIVTVTACKSAGSGNAGMSPSPSPSTTSPPAGDVAGVISSNHGHIASVTHVELVDGGAVSMNIRGTADHDHTVDLTSDQVHQVAAGTKVSVLSTVGTTQQSDGYGGYTTYTHTHTVTFN